MNTTRRDFLGAVGSLGAILTAGKVSFANCMPTVRKPKLLFNQIYSPTQNFLIALQSEVATPGSTDQNLPTVVSLTQGSIAIPVTLAPIAVDVVQATPLRPLTTGFWTVNGLTNTRLEVVANASLSAPPTPILTQVAVGSRFRGRRFASAQVASVLSDPGILLVSWNIAQANETIWGRVQPPNTQIELSFGEHFCTSQPVRGLVPPAGALVRGCWLTRSGQQSAWSSPVPVQSGP
jgi:hypothetical protein